MKNKYEPNKRKPIREINSRKTYWDFLALNQNNREDGELREDALANPDILSEEDTLYDRPLTEDGELRLQAIKNTLAKLSLQQQTLIRLCGEDGYSIIQAAKIMKITPSTAQVFLRRARTKIDAAYRALRLKGDIYL